MRVHRRTTIEQRKSEGGCSRLAVVTAAQLYRHNLRAMLEVHVGPVRQL